jgi:hypothetical protein
MSYSTSEGRQQLLDTLAEATDELGFALACLAEAYDSLDAHNADRLEAELFRPVQVAYGRAQLSHTEFAGRHGLPGRTFEQPSAGVSPAARRASSTKRSRAIGEADRALTGLQDSMLPVEVGDAVLRSGLVAMRDRLRGPPERARELLRTIGR